MKHLAQKIKQELSAFYEPREAESFLSIIFESKLGISKTQRLIGDPIDISEEQKAEIEHIVSRLKNYEPIQYIIGETEFLGMRLKVNPSVLIPRPETEELVEIIANSCPQAKDILDIGTGSGCIAIGLKHLLPSSQVYAIDISQQALKIARQNAKDNELFVAFVEQDILKTDNLDGEFDIIVSNPPYIKHSEKADMKPNVLNYEPHTALFVEDDNPLIFYKKIAFLAYERLRKNGYLYFEINREEANNIRDMLLQTGFIDVEIKKDIFGNNRFAVCRKQ